MKNKAKLSIDELSLLKNKELILLKNLVLLKLKQNFSELSTSLEKTLNTKYKLLCSELEFIAPKISRGENYEGLPYLVLDYPAQFSNNSIFTYRSFFWWGNFFSFTLHLQGKFLQKFKAALLRNSAKLVQSDLFFCVNDSPWDYSYNEHNYIKISRLSIEDLKKNISERSFIKISAKIEIENYDAFISQGILNFEKIMAFLC